MFKFTSLVATSLLCGVRIVVLFSGTAQTLHCSDNLCTNSFLQCIMCSIAPIFPAGKNAEMTITSVGTTNLVGCKFKMVPQVMQ